MSGSSEYADRQQASWVANAEAWTSAVRTGQIASRRNGTDAAIVEACRIVGAMRVLDVGCGEGWLSRALASRGADVLGTDASEPLIDAARAAGQARYQVASYADLIDRPEVAPGPFDVIVCNFALLDEDLVPLLSALRGRLHLRGRLVVQTVHPVAAMGADGYVDGWQEERFAAFGGGFSAPMPWFFRTFATWHRTVRDSGLALRELREPRTVDGQVLSLLMECVIAES